ncbi:cytochrome c [Fluviispira multicolorata]|uniref:C-type cytochrome n=1 Tax=Fluviispira multicolorata TaxID=2654512 RepID=A0A833JD09_9BACT|nr:c-type cytochrome [Fluviispira multicolorata]KAB8029967.1 c-type cytochrome [Fluviispira multicolorata]
MTTENEDKNKKKEVKFIDHDFDGIKELDNPIPLWFHCLFYGTIILGAAYLLYYQIYKGGNTLKKDYLASMEQNSGESPKGENVPFDYKNFLQDKDKIKSGKQIYASNCGSCHGMSGQGGVGPNLTDDFWIAGDTYADVQKIIEEGEPAKGMPGWKSILGDKKIQDLVIYIASIQGTNPPGAKKAEGKAGKLH